MSRSYKKTPIVGNTKAPSDKPFKRQVNRAFRTAAKQHLNKGMVESMPIYLDELRSVWDAPKDGKNWFGHGRMHRFNILSDAYIKKLMRK